MNGTGFPLDGPQRAAVDFDLDAWTAIVGDAGTGKSAALCARAERARAALRGEGRVLLTAPGDATLRALRKALENPATEGLICGSLASVALDVLKRTPAATAFELIDDARAEELFAEATTSLFALDWDEFLSSEIDFEITGMRAPERFARTAFRVIRKLRIAGCSPADFEADALRAATAFYGRLPNFANPDLIEKTQPAYRDSLRASAAELARQHAAEVALTRIVARLYRTYIRRIADYGCITGIDALVEATRILEVDESARADARTRYRFAFVDAAQDLTRCDARFLRALFGRGLAGVTLAGDPNQRTLAFAAPREEAILDAPNRFMLQTQHRASQAIAGIGLAAVDPAAVREPLPHASAFRAPSMRSEAATVALAVANALREGVAPREIAIIARSLRCTGAYLEALLERNVPVDPAGAGSLYEYPDVADALCALWSVADPFRNDWLLRNLEAPWLNLADATVALLCGEPDGAQQPLFELTEAAADESDRRWDPRRDFRLAWNVLRGDRDAELGVAARARLDAFRAARSGWLEERRALDVPALARRIFADTVLASAPVCVADAALHARERLRRNLVERLASDIERFCTPRPLATLHDYLLHAERLARSDDEALCVDPRDADAVALLGVEAAKGREFARVFVVDARAGAFPRYYVPDAFQFSPTYGMVAKENVGDDAVAARTAKFTYLQYKLDVRGRYHAEERRALYCALTRARERVSLSAWGRATRGAGAPEFLEELRSVAGDPAQASI